MGKYSSRYAAGIGAVAIHLLGEPDLRTANYLRWGRKFARVVNVAGPRAGTFYDFSIGRGGDTVRLVMSLLGLSFPRALLWLNEFMALANTAPYISSPSKAVTTQPKIWSTMAESIWTSAIPLGGTLGEAYLRHRHCYVHNAAELRFLNGAGKHPPAICARVTDYLSGEPTTLHFTKLDPSCAKVCTHFLAGHKKAGGVVRLVPCVNVGGTLGVAEGIETALSIVAQGKGPVWSALDAGNLSALPTTVVFPVLNIWADNDPPGLKAAELLADRLYLSGHSVRVIIPPVLGTDWNDVVREEKS